MMFEGHEQTLAVSSIEKNLEIGLCHSLQEIHLLLIVLDEFLLRISEQILLMFLFECSNRIFPEILLAIKTVSISVDSFLRYFASYSICM